jgi:hypothetical protein
MYPRELETDNYTMWMFIEALFITAQSWKQSKCPSPGDWLNALISVHMTKYYLAMKRNKLSIWQLSCVSRASGRVKKANLWLQTVWSHERYQQDYRDGEWVVVQGLEWRRRREMSLATKQSYEGDLCGRPISTNLHPGWKCTEPNTNM